VKVLIAGGSGFMGRALTQRLEEAGHEPCWLSRDPQKQSQRALSWEHEALTEAISEFQAVVNLAGVNLFDHRWNEAFKKEILDSRLFSVKALGEALKASGHRPEVFVQGSAIGFYGSHNSSEDYVEETPAGNDFLSETCSRWEAAVRDYEECFKRLVIIRTGVVLGQGGGALSAMIKPFKMFVGGPVASGKQWVSWIHLKDIVGLFYEAIINKNYQGLFNGTSPNPVTNKEQCQSLAKHLNRPCLIPVPAFTVRLLLGDVADLVVNGQRIFPKRAQEQGFTFEFPEIDSAFKDLC
jgi:uncharacterized protein (TIGR01777 family)